MISFLGILEQTALYAPLLMGAYLDIGLMKLPDLSLTSAFTFGAIVGVKMLALCHTLPQPLALLLVVSASLIGGMCVGALSSALTQRAHFPHLLSSIITEGLFHGVTQLVLGSSNSSLSAYTNPLDTSLLQQYPELPLLAVISTLIVIGMFLFLKTPLGTACSIYGQNPRFFNHYPISLPYVFTAGVMLSNGLAGLAGYYFAQSNGFVDCSMGMGIPLFAITVLLVGKTLSIKYPLIAALGGLLIYFLLQQLLLIVGFNLNYFTCIQSCILLCILLNSTRNKTIFTSTGI